MLVDLRNKGITGKEAEFLLGLADITVNKNMVPFDTESPFVTSGIRLGTAALTTRGVQEDLIPLLVEIIDEVLMSKNNEDVIEKNKNRINELMSSRPLFAW
jgi:glycine hydroxymethyltransferase